MAKKTNTNTTVVKQKIHMQLIQNFVDGKALSVEEKEDIYRSFRTRAKEKSEMPWRDSGIKPELLRLYFNGSTFDSTQEMLVEVGSFKPIMAKSESGKMREIGFEIRVKSPMTLGRPHRLEVLRKQYKATLFISV